MLGRRIERSPILFARDRWISSAGRDIDFATGAFRRADVSGWADDRARLPVDPELGPPWHLGILPLEGGGAALSLVVSHSVADGIGMCRAVADAVAGKTRNLGYPPPHSRNRTRAVFEDARQTARAMPEQARGLAAAVRLIRRNRADFASSVASAPRSRVTDDRAVLVSAVTAHIPVAHRDASTKNLGGTSNSLFAGFASRLSAEVGRFRDDGMVTLSFPVSERTEADLRANALTSVVVAVDPEPATTDLTDIRTKIKAALTALGNQPNEILGPLPLAPMVPKWFARKLTGIALGTADVPIGCSNVGELDPAVNRPDGSDADYFSLRLIEPGLRKSDLDRMGGQLFLVSARVYEKVFIAVAAHLVDRKNSKDSLRQLVCDALAEFGLMAVIE